MVSPGLHHGLPPLYSPIFKLYPLIVNGSFPKMPGSFERQGFEPLRFWIENSSRHFAGENPATRKTTMIFWTDTFFLPQNTFAANVRRRGKSLRTSRGISSMAPK